MKLSSRSEYAILALIYLARKIDCDHYISAEKIALCQNIPLRFLEQILYTLKRANLVNSLKGQKGGFKLAKKPNEITIAEVIRLLDGALAPTLSVSTYFYEHTPIEKEEKVKELFRNIRNIISNQLEKTTLKDLI